MKPRRKRLFFTGIPAWAQALIVLFTITILLFVLPDRWGESSSAEAIAYIVLGILNAVCCYLIVRQYPASFWYVPVIINAMYIISACVEYNGLRDWLFLGGMWAASIAAAIIGAWEGRKAKAGTR